MNSLLKVGLACVLCVLGAGASLAAEVEVSIPNGSTTWTSAIAGKTINEGDILSVTIGDNLTSYSLGGWVSPKLAGVKVSGNKAWNISIGTFNFQPTATFEVVGTTRVILNTLKIGSGATFALEKMGTGTLQFLGPQTCEMKLVVSAGNVYVHQDSALGVVPTTVVADAITLNGGTLLNGFNNTALGTVRLAATRGITIAEGKTGLINVVKSDVSANTGSDFIIDGPISGSGDLKLIGTTVFFNENPVVVRLGGVNTFTGSLTLGVGYYGFEPGCVLPTGVTLNLTAEASNTIVLLNGTKQTVGKVANNNFTLWGPGLLTMSDWTDRTPAPRCDRGAAVAVTEAQAASVDTSKSSYVVVSGGSVRLLDNARYGAVFTPKTFEFRFYDVYNTAAAYISLSEIALMKGGVPLDPACYDLSLCSASSANANYAVANLFDNCGNTYWRADRRPQGSPDYVSVRVTLKEASGGIDGYALGSGFNGETADSAKKDAEENYANPKNWDVYAIAADGTATLFDSRRDVRLAPVNADNNMLFKGELSIPFAFNQTGMSADGAVTIGSGATYLVAGADGQALTVSGAGGTLELGDGVVATADMSGFTGTVTADGEATLKLTKSANVGATAAEQSAVSYDAASDGVSLLVDDSSSADPLRGRLTGKVGLVKSGSGERTLWTERSDNTGKVAVQGGKLIVSNVRSNPETSVTARYIRFVTLKNANGGDLDNKINVSLNEFELLDETGMKIAWPSGKTIDPESGCSASSINSIIDGKINTRCYLTAEKTGQMPYFTIDTKTGVTFSKYRWYTAMNTSDSSYNSDKGRTPVQWQVWVSDDGDSWRLVHEGTHDVSDYTGWVDSNGFPRGPYDLDLSGARTASGFRSLPAEMVVKGADDVTAAAIKARYVRFMPFGTVAKPIGSGLTTSSNFGCAFSEFDLYREGERIVWTGGATMSKSSSAMYKDGANNSLVDNVFNDGNKRFYPYTFPFVVTIDAGAPVVFDGYGFHNDTANGSRRPNAWKFWVSNDNETWYETDARTDVQSSNVASAEAGRWSVAGKFAVTNTFTSTAIGDAAPVEIAQGATLRLDTDREAFGALSGAGTLELVRGAVAVVNAAADDTAFSGAVTGSGTLVIAGEGVQTFDGATLGDGVTLGFAGGALAGGLTVDGALAVEGDVKFAVPADATKDFCQQLLSWTSIDDASKTKLQAATIVNGSDLKTKNFKLVVTDTGCTLKYEAPGLLMIVR